MNNNQHVSDEDLDKDLEIRATAVADRIVWCERFEKATKMLYEATTDEMEDASVKELDAMIKTYPAAPPDKMKAIQAYVDTSTNIEKMWHAVKIAVMAQCIDFIERESIHHGHGDPEVNQSYVQVVREFLNQYAKNDGLENALGDISDYCAVEYLAAALANDLTSDDDELYFLKRFETVGAPYPYLA